MTSEPYDQREGVIWMNGEMVDWPDARLHVLSHALHYASSVFEGLRAYGGQIFELTQHCERLHESAAVLGFDIPYSAADIGKACRDVVAQNGLSEAYIRPVAWRGSEQMGVSAQETRINVAIATWDWGSYFDTELRLKGIRLAIAEYMRPDPRTAPVKSKAAGLYMICTIEKHRAEAAGYADALMYDWRGYVAEATGANIFLIKDGVINTPTPDCFLDGITRRCVIGLARKNGYEVVERIIKAEELGEFEECFITGTAAEVTAVAEIGPHKFTPGTITETLMDDYMALVRPAESVAATG